MSVHNELQPIYIIGDFDLAPAAAGWKLAPPSALRTGPWKDQALPFYAWAVSYAASYRLQGGHGQVKVRLGKWGGSEAEVKVNGKSAGVIGWQPYEADIGGLARPGENRIEVLVHGTLRNVLDRISATGTPARWTRKLAYGPAGAPSGNQLRSGRLWPDGGFPGVAGGAIDASHGDSLDATERTHSPARRAFQHRPRCLLAAVPGSAREAEQALQPHCPEARIAGGRGGSSRVDR